MFGIDQVITDGIKSILFIVALLIIIYRCGGGTILLRIILRAAGIRFKDNTLGRADDEVFYTQKFRLLNGVNVKDTHDAKLISKGILSGELSKSNFYFSSYFGAIGKNKFNIMDMVFIIFLGTCILVFALFVLSGLPKLNYAKFTYKGTSLQISMDNIYTHNSKEYLSGFIDVGACESIMKTHPDDAYRLACSYLVVDNKELTMELKDAIEMWDRSRNIAISVFIFVVFFIISLFIGGCNHYKLNNYIKTRRS
ncbi:hypothetical protein GCM10023078_15690 [Gibbsiella greigii]